MSLTVPRQEEIDALSQNQSVISTISSTEPIIQAMIAETVNENTTTLEDLSLFRTDNNIIRTIISDTVSPSSYNFTGSFINDETFTKTEDIFSTPSTTANAETSLSDLLTTYTSETRNNFTTDSTTDVSYTTGISESANNENTTFRSIVSDVTSTITDLFTTTTRSETTGHEHQNKDAENMNDITLYVIVGLVIGLLIVSIIIFYFYCKKYKNGPSKSGDYYVSQYTNTTNC